MQDELDYFGFLQGDDAETLAAHARAARRPRASSTSRSARPRDDDAFVAAVREAIGPEPLLRIDPNEAWDAATAVERIRRLAQLRPRLGRAARRRTGTSPGSRACAARST